MPITDWPADERPREKLLAHGAGTLSDAELLAIFLRTGIKGKSAVDLARELPARFGGLRPLLKADQTEFCEAKGLGEAKYVQLQAVLEIARRHLAETLPERDALQHPDEVRDYLRARLRDLPYESFVELFLNAQHRVIVCEELARGTLDGASVYAREVVKAALKHNATVEIRVLDHFIVGEGAPLSFAERWLL